MLLSDFQRECLLDFVKDKMNDDRNKITFIFNYLVKRDQLGDFADYVGSHYGFKVPWEEMEEKLKEKNATRDSEEVSQQVEGSEADPSREVEQAEGENG